MGRPEPRVIYAQTFVHPHLDEYVDEVLFAEPVVISSCEFLEQNASSLCPAVKLMGATSPPSFAVEVFIQCEGEAKFRRLSLPCLYSHSSSNVLEVEVVVTSHLVVRGSYRSLSMVIYGNTAEDLGQFNIEVDLEGSLTDTVSAIEGNLEDLPPAFHPSTPTIRELVSPLKILSRAVGVSDIPPDLRKYLLLVFNILDSQNVGIEADKVMSFLLSASSIYGSPSAPHKPTDLKQPGIDRPMIGEEEEKNVSEVGIELLNLYKKLQNQYGDPSTESSSDSPFLESEFSTPTSKDLVDTLHRHFDFFSSSGSAGFLHLSQNKNTIIWLIMARLLCSTRESCFHFVNYGGMKQLGYVFAHRTQNSATLTLLLLGVIEQATRHSSGCEGFLGWWPREHGSIPTGTSSGYNQLLKLLLESQRHDVASLATYILRRLRFYEVACRYENAALCVLEGISTARQVTNLSLDMLATAKMQLGKLLKLIESSGPIGDPSPVAAASKFFILGDSGQLTYKTTMGLIKQYDSGFTNWDIDQHILFLLKERGFLPLSAALLSSAVLRSETGHTIDLFVDIVSFIEAILLSLLFCRSGLDFLLHDPELSSTVIYALRGSENVSNEDSLSLRYASVLLSKGFFCRPKEVGFVIEMHMRALIAVDSLCKSTPNTEEFLWALWNLCRLSRSECGRQAMLVLVIFPEAIKVLIAALHSGRESDPIPLITGVSPLNLAIFHAAAEILEVIVSDSTAISLLSWVDHGKELHKALHAASPGSNRKDAPARLLEWIDAGVVYHRNGVIGLIRYAAVLTSGGEVHMASNSVLASDMMDVDNVVGDSSSSSDGNIIDNLIGKRITEKDFPGIIIRDSSVTQLTTAFRILAFISDNSDVAAALYNEGAVMVIHAVLINCKLMLERSSNTYADYLLDEGAEGNSTSDLLLERNREKNLFDMLIPSLVLLINLLQKLQGAKEQHRNAKLMDALLQLHREVSPKLAACAVELQRSCPDIALSFGAACHLLASALACWPAYSWTPGLFHFLVDNLHATSLLALGPKETCSLFCLLNDLFPGERIGSWENGMPMLSPLRSMAVATLLGPTKEKQINWYLESGNAEKLVNQLSPQLVKLGEIILHCAVSMSVVIQDVIRTFVIRIACQNLDYASALMKPTVSWISNRLLEPSMLSDVDAYKVHQLLTFIAILMEHPNAKPILLREGGFQLLSKVLEKCIGTNNSDVKLPRNTNLAKYDLPLLSWSIPVFRSISLVCDGRASVQHAMPDRFTEEEFSVFWFYLLKLCTVVPVGKELIAYLSAFKEMASCTEGQNALLSMVKDIPSNTTEESDSQIKREDDASCSIIHATEWKERPPFLCCWITLIRAIDSEDIPAVLIPAAVDALVSGALRFCMDGQSANMERIAAIKLLFGVDGCNTPEAFVQENLKHIEELPRLLGSEMSNETASSTSHQIKDTANLLLLLLKTSSASEEVNASLASGYASLVTPVSSRMHRFADTSMDRFEDSSLDEFGDLFFWECPENLRNRLTQTGLSGKRKISALEGANRHPRGDNLVAESASQNTFSRGSAPVTTPPGPTRRDTFRQRKPNTSRPPSMHVDDYVARERNADGTNTSNVIAVPRIGSSSGRPPSIHVDVFMARQRERQNIVGIAVNDAPAEVKPLAPDENIDAEKLPNKSRQLKPEIDDDLQGIDIVFDAEESEPDDKLPFPQPDDNLQQPSSVVVETLSPHSIVEETESDLNESSQLSRMGTPLASNMDENTPSEYSSRMSASRLERPLAREPSISSDKKFPDQSENPKRLPIRTPNAIDSSAMPNTGLPSSAFMNTSPSARFPVDSGAPPNLYPKLNRQQSGNVPLGQGFYDPKFPANQPPLPPFPPPPTVSPLMSQNMDPAANQSSPFIKSAADLQTQVPPFFNVQSEYASAIASSVTSLTTSMALPDQKFGRPPMSSARPPPPLPPTPPPYSTNSSFKNSSSQSPQFFQAGSSSELQQPSVSQSVDATTNLSASRPMHAPYHSPHMMQPIVGRPGSAPVSMHGNNLVPHHGDNLPNVSQNIPVSMPLMQPIPTLTQLQPLQPPHIPRPPPQHLRPPVPASQSEQGVSMLQVPLQQHQVSPAHAYYQTVQQENVSHVMQQQVDHSQRTTPIPGDGISQQQDPGMSLQEYFRSPEAIQALVNDKEKLCQLLEQHPKLMQMLQERL